MTLPVLVVMTRWPASGRCKRRLAHALGASPAARIQSRLIAHTLTVARNMAAQQRLHLHIAVSGAGPVPVNVGWHQCLRPGSSARQR